MNLAYLGVMHFALPKKALVFFLAWGAFCLGPTPSQAGGPKLGRQESRSLTVWEQPVEYQFILENNPRVAFDGEAFRKQIKGQEIHFVVLNEAYFRKEAKDLFERFEKNSSSMESNPISGDELQIIEKQLMSKISSDGLPSLNQNTMLSLKQFKEYLEYLAWSPLYRTSLQESGSRKEAERLFENKFVQTRLETIEWHEASHLSDLKGNRDTTGETFGRFTELNAFFAELTYGTNPNDVMAQALAGLIDELHQGKNVDFSFQKVVAVFKFLKECPRFTKHQRLHQTTENGPLSGSCLEILARLKTEDFMMVGRELRQQNLRASGQNLASLR